MKVLLLFIAIFFLSCQDQPGNKHLAEPISADSGFISFWKKFRTALLNFDTAGIAGMTQFPLQADGTLDSDPTVFYNKNEFVRILKIYLNQPVYELKSDNPSTTSEFEVIKRTEIPEITKEGIQHNSASVGDMWFYRESNQWKLRMISFSDESLDELKKSASSLDCIKLFQQLVEKSSFNPEIKKMQYKVFVDQFSAGVVTLKITVRNTERNDDVAISWLKMDINKETLGDITADPGKPSPLTYDTAIFRQIVENCRFSRDAGNDD